ncbi:type II toxin-antitoxin system RatA family toxin [Gallibacterium anatis]|uniref:type II toxin-antitoxin system RatA family toxin n=1 Tax=Gallibacterium anatis TaxID=750 RepID=UPI000B9FC50E|nr:type II toxin-antitoxin system RatA family toxin [Gallibacterium anatis]WAX70692.1 type II toxin-antitoxin system RatA family toxin [Gallibacterium anatis]
MNRVSQTMLVPHSAEQMYQLVNNYQRYPEFLPGCISGKTLHQQGNELDAELIVSKAGIRLAFTTHNTMQPNQSIQMKLMEGPFKHLNGEWRFLELDEYSSQISLQLQFSFSNALVEKMFGKIFQQLTSQMVQAFKQRAKEIYRV